MDKIHPTYQRHASQKYEPSEKDAIWTSEMYAILDRDRTNHILIK